MRFKSELSIPENQFNFSHTSPALSLGSCFAAEIGRKLSEHLFDCCVNPLGTLFNPIAIARIITRAIDEEYFEPSEFFENLELWRHNLVHSSLAQTSAKLSLEQANARLRELRAYLLKSDLLILSLGSAWGYKLKCSGTVVGHNHRRPLDTFSKELLEPKEIVESLTPAIKKLKSLNPKLSICLTVSPVRHSKDGLHANNLSKSSLHLASYRLLETYSHINYFPAFEMLIDELRDYRFYEEDLVHPTRAAISYIWEAFMRFGFDEETCERIDKINRINNTLNHRPHHIDTNSYKSLKTVLLRDIEELSEIGLNVGLIKDKWKSLP